MSSCDELVYGERIDDLSPALDAIAQAGSIDDDGSFVFSVEIEPGLGRPMLRALMRVEAELLLEDAEALRSGRYEQRTSDQRALDALVRLAETIRARSSGNYI